VLAHIGIVLHAMKKISLCLTILLLGFVPISKACSVLYYISPQTGKIYIANNEDYWYDVKPYIQIIPATKDKHARLWYGWDKFAQGGVNAAGLFFDGAVTPKQEAIRGYNRPKGNLGDRLLANCSTVDEAIAYLEKEKIALSDAHIMLGDKQGKAVVLEWVDGKKNIIPIENNRLVMTNFLLSDTTRGNYPCYRYSSILRKIDEMEQGGGEITFLKAGNTMGQAAQPPKADEQGRVGGTLYSTFINLTDMEFILVYKLNNKRITKLNLEEIFKTGKNEKIKLEG
jgi:hypothetical protein